MSEKGERKGGVEEFDRLYTKLKKIWSVNLAAGMLKSANLTDPALWAQCAREDTHNVVNDTNISKSFQCLQLRQTRTIVPYLMGTQEAACQPQTDAMKKAFILDSTLAERQEALNQLMKCWRPANPIEYPLTYDMEFECTAFARIR